jgi:voltage-gated potassium channel
MSIRKHHEFMLEYALILLTAIRRPAFLFLGLLTLTLMGFFSVLIYLIESPTNPKMATLFESVYFTVCTMTSVGYGDITPGTAIGKLITIAMMLLGTFIFVSFTGVIASTVLEAELESRKKRPH